MIEFALRATRVRGAHVDPTLSKAAI